MNDYFILNCINYIYFNVTPVVGNPEIFTTTRKLIMEGELERIRTSAGVVSVKVYYAHLFNDAIMWSQHNNKMGTFKLTKIMNLNCASITFVSSIAGLPHSFAITGIGTVEVFRSSTAQESQIWFTEIEKVINFYKQNQIAMKSKENTPRETVLNFTKLPLNKSLGTRASFIYKFLNSEMRLADLFSVLSLIVFKPLLEASKGLFYFYSYCLLS